MKHFVPLCFSNSILGEKFVEHFPGMSLPAVMSEFSLPSQLGEHRDVLGLPQQQVSSQLCSSIYLRVQEVSASFISHS